MDDHQGALQRGQLEEETVNISTEFLFMFIVTEQLQILG